MRLIDPIDGVILHTAGSQDGRLRCALQDAGPGARIRVSETGETAECRWENGLALAEVHIPIGGATLVASDSGGHTAAASIGRVHTPRKVFRLSVDDCVWFLQYLATHADRCESLFDAPLMALLRRLHGEYGVAVHMNIYNECPEHGGFALSQMPERYRDEWLRNRDWLRLSFHARADKPDWPYTDGDAQALYRDCAEVMAQIRRFAGYADAVTTLHWASASGAGVRALYDCGVRALLGDFAYDPADGSEYLCYRLGHEPFEAVRRYCFWRDAETGMIFFPCDVVLNTLLPGEIPAELDRFAARWPDRNFVDILIHEQYFYPDYVHYEPDYEQRLRAGIEWCLAHDYAPGLVSQVLGFEAR